MSLRHALLGLLSIEPMSGYELKKVIDASVGHFWSSDRSQIYRGLHALVDERLVTKETVPQDGRPAMHIHRLTPAGEEVLDGWLSSPLRQETVRDEFLARLFFAGRLAAADVQALLQQRRNEVAARLTALEATGVPPGEDRSFAETLRVATLENGIVHARTELAWLDDLGERVRAEHAP